MCLRLEDELGAVVILHDVEDQDGHGSVRLRVGLRAGDMQAEATVSVEIRLAAGEELSAAAAAVASLIRPPVTDR